MTATPDSALTETPDLYGAFPRLSEEQIAALSTVGERRRVKAGDVLYREGDGNCDFFVILAGKVAVVEESEEGERVVGVHGPRRFLGELGLITGQAVFVTAIVREPGEVLVVSPERLREIVTQDVVLGDLILRALIMRRAVLIGLGVGFRIVGSRYSPDTRRLREFAIRNRLPHHWVDLESDPGAEEILQRLGVRPEECPVVLLGPRSSAAQPEQCRAGARAGTAARRTGRRRRPIWSSSAPGRPDWRPRCTAPPRGSRRSCSSRWPPGGRPACRRGSRTTSAFRPASPAGARRARDDPGAEVRRADHHPRRGRRPRVARRRVPDPAARRRDAVRPRGRDRRPACATARCRSPISTELEGISVHYAATRIEAQLCRGEPVVAVGGGNSAGQATLLLSPGTCRA